MNKRFNYNFNFLTAISIFDPIPNNYLNDNFILKCKNDYEYDEYFSNKIFIQSRLAKNMFSSCKNIMDL